MKNAYPKKFAVIGLPGSGKSTFAAKLGKILSLPVHHLDRHMFEPGGKKIDKQEFIETQKAILEEEAWIVEGCSFSTFEMRFAKADVVIYFHFSRLICFLRFFKRMFNYNKDFGGLRAINWGLLKYTWNFNKHKRARIEELREKYHQADFYIFRNQKDADLFLRQSANFIEREYKLELIKESNSHIFDELAQDYEDEFSLTSGKKKNQDGKYFIDADWRIPNVGYYWKEGSEIAGFSIVEPIDGYSEIVDFYVVPAYRKKMVGKNMAFAVFNKHPGPWRVRQIPGSEAATKFWRKVIREYTKENYTESQIENPPWGLSACQIFNNQV